MLGEGAGERESERARERERFAASLGRFWDDAFTWFGQADDPVFGQLRKAGLMASDPDGLRERLAHRMGPVLTGAGLDELTGRQLPWERWDAVARRLRTVG